LSVIDDHCVKALLSLDVSEVEQQVVTCWSTDVPFAKEIVGVEGDRVGGDGDS